MKLLAIEEDVAGITPEQFAPHLKAEAQKVWALYQAGTIREIYFRSDRSNAVLVLECKSVVEAEELIHSLPLVKAGLIRFDVIPLMPYPGFARLFEDGHGTCTPRS